MIDYNVILDHFIAAAQEGVGNELSQVGPVGFEEPAVIRARQDGPKPDYPYIVLDVLNTQQLDGWLLQEGVDDNDDPFMETTYQLTLSYTVYGSNATTDAIGIANKLEGFFRLRRILDDIKTVTGGSLNVTFPIISTPQALADKFIEAAQFNFNYSIIDRITDPESGIFDTIELDGELSEGVDDPSPLPIDVLVTSIP